MRVTSSAVLAPRHIAHDNQTSDNRKSSPTKLPRKDSKPAMAVVSSAGGGGGYDRAADVKAFDETRAGVKGLLDAGITHVPRIFIAPPENRSTNPNNPGAPRLEIPTIGLQGPDRKAIVEEIRRASETWGFFQVLDHGIPNRVLDEMIEAVRRFNEQGGEEKTRFFSRDPQRKVKYNSNFDLYESRAANWRDTLFCWMSPEPPTPDELPAVCRETMMEYSKYVSGLAETVLEFLSEALGLKPTHLKDMECVKGHNFVSHYYPPCPEPDLTFGTSSHSDPSFLTVLLQDQIGGLQVLHQDQWVDVPPKPGALVINLGDLLQLISNDRFKSVQHRVLANRLGPRISVACFFTRHLHSSSTLIYGPIKELLSEENPAVYKGILEREYITHYYSKGLGESSLLDFKL